VQVGSAFDTGTAIAHRVENDAGAIELPRYRGGVDRRRQRRDVAAAVSADPCDRLILDVEVPRLGSEHVGAHTSLRVQRQQSDRGRLRGAETDGAQLALSAAPGTASRTRCPPEMSRLSVPRVRIDVAVPVDRLRQVTACAQGHGEQAVTQATNGPWMATAWIGSQKAWWTTISRPFYQSRRVTEPSGRARRK
jgi:hypothetical protein